MSKDTEKPKCPKCGAILYYAYGMAGGGMGPYWYCDGPEEGQDCDYFRKEQDPGCEPHGS